MAEEQQTQTGAEGSTQQAGETQVAASGVDTPVTKTETPDPLAAGEGAVSQAVTVAEEPAPEVTLEYPEYQDDTANSIVGTLKNAKVPPEKAKDIFAEAVQSLDVSKLDMDALAGLVGKDGAELTKLRLEKYFEARKTQVAASVAAVHEVFGSKATSDKVFAWANAKAKADPAFKLEFSELVQMLDKSKTQAQMASEALKRKYEADPENSSLGVKMVNGDKSAAVIADDAKLTRAQYLDAVKQAHRAGDFKEVERLQKIRLQTMQDQE